MWEELGSGHPLEHILKNGSSETQVPTSEETMEECLANNIWCALYALECQSLGAQRPASNVEGIGVWAPGFFIDQGLLRAICGPIT